MQNFWKQYAPYEGDEPYVFLAFAERDKAAARPILKLLLQRGFRVWYCAAGSDMALRLTRAKAAAVSFLYLSDAAAEDANLKSLVLNNQKAGRPIVILNPDGGDRRLAMNLREATPEIPLNRLHGAELEAAFIRAPGVSHAVMGRPVTIRENKKLPLLLCALAAVFLVLSLTGLRHGNAAPQEDSVVITDTALREAARSAAGGRLTEEVLSGITVLRLTECPGSWEELSLFPALERLELSQELAMKTETLPEGYVLVLTGGGA